MRQEQSYLWAPDEYWELTAEQLRDLIGEGGCGPGGIGDYLVPDKLYGVIDVKPACQIHDYMYEVGKDETDKEEADQAFLMNLKQIVWWETAGWYEDKKRRDVVREECFRQAENYYKMVKVFGGPSFWAGKTTKEETT